jgi:uncharacterized damage-inducible protein DinB
MSEPVAVCFLTSAIQEMRTLRERAEQALAQTDDEAFFTPLDAESNSIAILVKHLAGNMRSRWRDFLDSDGEKPDRDRDREFEIAPEDTRDVLRERWEAGWRLLFEALAGLDAGDLTRTVLVRGEPMPVERAILRQLDHYAYHVGQIVLLRHRGAVAPLTIAWRLCGLQRAHARVAGAGAARWRARVRLRGRKGTGTGALPWRS